MLIPFDMILVMLFLGYYTSFPITNPPPLTTSLAVIAAGCVAMLAGGWLLNRLALWQLGKLRGNYSRRRALAGQTDMVVRLALAGCYIAALMQSALPWSVMNALGWTVSIDSAWLQLVGLAPYLLFFFLAWLPMYRFHRETSFGSWTRTSFLVNKARYNLFMLAAWLPFAVLADWLSEVMMALPLLFLLAAWSFPFLLAKVWGCKTLPEGETLDLVRRLEKQTGAKVSKVYLWEPGGGGTQNAAAVGIFRPFRYLFLTPALIANMSTSELEGVVLHELGHIKRRHLLFYLFTSLAGINLAVLAGYATPVSSNIERFAITVLLILGYFRLVFGWLSRNMERQADAFALEQHGSAGPLANALEKLAISAGNIRRAASWHHLGIAERVDFLRRAERHPEMVAYHNRKVGAIKTVGYAASIMLIVGMTVAVHDELSATETPQQQVHANSRSLAESHWRRVMRLMPGNSTAPLELAYHLAENPANREEAAELAEKALALACDTEEKEAASKLMRELGEWPAVTMDNGGTGFSN